MHVCVHTCRDLGKDSGETLAGKAVQTCRPGEQSGRLQTEQGRCTGLAGRMAEVEGIRRGGLGRQWWQVLTWAGHEPSKPDQLPLPPQLPA